MDTTPQTCREWKGKIVIVTSEMRNRGGCVFHKGERLIVRRKCRDGTFELYRPEASIAGELADAIVLDPEQRAFY